MLINIEKDLIICQHYLAYAASATRASALTPERIVTGTSMLALAAADWPRLVVPYLSFFKSDCKFKFVGD